MSDKDSSSSPVLAEDQCTDAVPQNGLSKSKMLAGLTVLVIGFIIAIIETTITPTALFSIGRHFDNVAKAEWVVLSYLLAFVAFPVVICRTSDIVGTSTVVIASVTIFGAFSLGAGFSQTIDQLIALRTLQGIGGAGLICMFPVASLQMGGKELWALFSAFGGLGYCLGTSLGPILGGVIPQTSSWRWIYLFNGPFALLIVVTQLLVFPPNLRSFSSKAARACRQFLVIDYVGTVLLIAASVLLVLGLEQAGRGQWTYSSAAFICCMAFDGVSWIIFFLWSWALTYRRRTNRQRLQAIIPFGILATRPAGPALLVSLCAGFVYITPVVQLPLLFQVGYGESAILAGVKTVPFTACSGIGSFLGGVLCQRGLLVPTTIMGGIFMVIGTGLLSSIPPGLEMTNAIYGYQVIHGLGVGLSFVSVVVVVKSTTPDDEHASGQGAIVQTRFGGGAIGAASATIIFGKHLVHAFSGSLPPATLTLLQQTLAPSVLDTLSDDQLYTLRRVYTQSFRAQMCTCMYIAVVGLVAALATWTKRTPLTTTSLSSEGRAKSEPDQSAEA